MSLIVAEKINDKVIIVGEVLLSKNNENKSINILEEYDDAFNSKDELYKIASCIKNIIIDKNISISFAGSPIVAREALKEIKNKAIDEKDNILEILYNLSKRSNENCDTATDFMAYFGEPYNKLYRIDKDAILDQDLAYIGDLDAYREYKKTMKNIQEISFKKIFI